MGRTYNAGEKRKIHTKVWLEDLMEEIYLQDPDPDADETGLKEIRV
jgi:hypothetical protein